MVPVRRVERLPNGYWRADLFSGSVMLYATDPTNDRTAKQVH
jgi:hypothetical protein